MKTFKKNFNTVLISFLFLLIVSEVSKASGILDEQFLSSPENDLPPKYYSLNLVTSRELKDRLLGVLSGSPSFSTLTTMIELDQMTYVIDDFYFKFFQKISSNPYKKYEETVASFAKAFRDYINQTANMNSVTLTEQEISNVYSVVYDVLDPKNNTCSRYLKIK